MKEFLLIFRRFVPPYKRYIVLAVVFNLLAALLNVFSFAALIPILQILFRTQGTATVTTLMPWDWNNIKEVASNNADYYVRLLIDTLDPATTLLVIGLFLAFMTLLKTGANFVSSASLTPIRTGIVRDIRNQLYRKITSLPLGFFSEERKGDIIARMTGDVQEVENSIMASLDISSRTPYSSCATSRHSSSYHGNSRSSRCSSCRCSAGSWGRWAESSSATPSMHRHCGAIP